jgi:hypothetical protein
MDSDPSVLQNCWRGETKATNISQLAGCGLQRKLSIAISGEKALAVYTEPLNLVIHNALADL